MLILDKIKIGDVVSFSLHSRTQALIRTDFSNCIVKSVLDAEDVQYQRIDPYALHASVYGTLPSGVPDSADGYSWLKVVLANGTTTCIGVPYILESTIVINSTTTRRFTVENCSQEDAIKIAQAIAGVGKRVSLTETL